MSKEVDIEELAKKLYIESPNDDIPASFEQFKYSVELGYKAALLDREVVDWDEVKELKTIEGCLEEAPIDFVGTGGGPQCQIEEDNWYKEWREAIKSLKEHYTLTPKQNGKD